MPVPKWPCQIRFTITRAVSGFLLIVLAIVAPTFLSLKLDRDGFTTVRIGGRNRLVRWQDANHFEAVEPYPWIALVAFDVANAKNYVHWIMMPNNKTVYDPIPPLILL